MLLTQTIAPPTFTISAGQEEFLLQRRVGSDTRSISSWVGAVSLCRVLVTKQQESEQYQQHVFSAWKTKQKEHILKR